MAFLLANKYAGKWGDTSSVSLIPRSGYNPGREAIHFLGRSEKSTWTLWSRRHVRDTIPYRVRLPALKIPYRSAYIHQDGKYTAYHSLGLPQDKGHLPCEFMVVLLDSLDLLNFTDYYAVVRSWNLAAERLGSSFYRDAAFNTGFRALSDPFHRWSDCVFGRRFDYGWGQFLGQYISLPVTNNAVAGTSARSYTTLGLFNTLISEVKSGDFVVIEFGHNDGSAGAIDNGDEDAVGDALNLTQVVTEANGSTEVIHSFNFYITNAAEALISKGAIPIISSQTPDNIWDGNVLAPPSRFVAYAQEVAGNTSLVYIDHFDYVAQAYEALGETTVNTFYPVDHLHTSPAGANVVAEAFVRGLLCSNSALKKFVNSAGQAVPSMY
ncbi:carbohydrate esterase family 12 protein [Collybiopsis luxurians FD-317 M1]|nr:carbohydrate esterase family 12 protein [Collybiopsis luxurians FD-317 M1]